MPAFRVESTIDADKVELAVTGEIDMDNAGNLSTCGMEELNKPVISVLIVDLAGVSFMDSTGIGALVQLRNTANELNKRFSLSRVPERIQSLLHLTGLSGTFDQLPDRQVGDAVAPITGEAKV